MTTSPIGLYVRPTVYGAGGTSALTDPRFSPVSQEILGIAPPASDSQVSLGGIPNLIMEFFNWGAQTNKTGSATLNANGSIKTSNVRYVLFDDSVSTFTYWDIGASSTATFTNRADTTGNSNNAIGQSVYPKLFCENTRLQYPGATAVMTWRSGAVDSTNNMENGSAWQEEFTCAQILSGLHDTYIKGWGSQVADYLFAHQTMKLQVRFNQEMNGNNYNWGFNQAWMNPANPTNGPMLLNALTQTASSGNPIASTGGSSGIGGYGLYGGMFRHVVTLLKQTIVGRLVNLGLSLGAVGTPGTALFIAANNFQTIWCVGNGQAFANPFGAPADGNQLVAGGNPFTSVSNAYAGHQEQPFQAVFDGTNAVVKFAFPQTSSSSNPIGHTFPVGSLLAFTGTGTNLDTGTWKVTALTNTTVTLANTTTASTVAIPGTATCQLASVSNYVQQVCPWISFYPGDDAEAVYSLPIVDIVSIDGYNAQHVGTGWKQIQSIFDNTSSTGAYSSLVAAVNAGKPFQVTETACIENPMPLTGISTVTTTSPPVPDGVITGGVHLTSSLVTSLTTSLVGMQVQVQTGVPANTYVTGVTANVATLSQPCSNGTGLTLTFVPPVFADGSITVSGSGSTVKVASAALYSLTTSQDGWIVSGGSLPGYAYISSVSNGNATLVFPFSNGPTSNGTTTSVSLTLSPPQKSDWTTIGFSSTSTQAFKTMFPRMTGGVIIFDHTSAKVGGFVGTYNIRSSPSSLTAWLGIMSESSSWWTKASAASSYPQPSIGAPISTIIVREGVSTSTTIPYAAEPFKFLDSGRFGMGDGATAANVLPVAMLTSDLASATPPAVGVATIGTSTNVARQDHTHALGAIAGVFPKATDLNLLAWSGDLYGAQNNAAPVAAVNYMNRVANPKVLVSKVLLGVNTLPVDPGTGGTVGSGFLVWVCDGTGAVLGTVTGDQYAALKAATASNMLSLTLATPFTDSTHNYLYICYSIAVLPSGGSAPVAVAPKMATFAVPGLLTGNTTATLTDSAVNHPFGRGTGTAQSTMTALASNGLSTACALI